MTQNRIRCCVPYCRRTRKADDAHEWICQQHWSDVPPYLRKRKNRLFRLYRRRFGDRPYWQFPPGSDQRREAVRLERMCVLVWRQCKRKATERAMGI